MRIENDTKIFQYGEQPDVSMHEIYMLELDNNILVLVDDFTGKMNVLSITGKTCDKEQLNNLVTLFKEGVKLKTN